MFGIPDFGVWSGLLVFILSMVLCVVYGIVKWNSETEVSDVELAEEKAWNKSEVEMDEKVDGGV